jgi:DNA primase small subunit
LDSKALRDSKQDVVLEYTYPRLDVEVSKKLIHLLKSPFVVHPGTGRVCVPIDTRKLKDFDPLGVPTVTDLLAEIDDWDSVDRKSEEDTETKPVSDYEKTSLKPYVEFFKAHVAGIIKQERGVKREREDDDAMEF